MLLKEIIAIYKYYENYMKPVNMFSGKNADIFNVKADGMVKDKVICTLLTTMPSRCME